MHSVDVVVLGAGAAGLMCAIEAGRRGRSVVVLDHADRIGKKILISGGGRCNFTNLHCRPESFLSANPHFAKSALARFTPLDILAMVEKHKIAYHEKTLGQLFCDHSAQQIVTMLEHECRDAGVRILTGVKVEHCESVAPHTSQTGGPRFSVQTTAGVFRASSVVVATGGLSIPKMGATGLGYQIAEQFGLAIVPCRPALVPLVFDSEDRERWCDLSGLSTEVVAMAAAKRPVRFREKMLITHRGLSGPAILQVSSYWQPGQPIELDLAPECNVMAQITGDNGKRDSATLLAALRSAWPARFAERWLASYPPSGWSNAALDRFESTLHAWRVTPAGTEGYAKAEVTAGGVDTDGLDARTMESRRVPGLYFIGEVVDVTGWLGGYNFQWAWASGASAGRSA